MISTTRPIKKPSSTFSEIYKAEEEFTFQFTAPVALPSKPAGVRAEAPAVVQPKKFDGFLAMLLAFLVLGICLVMGIFYAALYTPTMTL